MTYLGQNIKKLGFGLMRLPMIGDDVDIEQTKQMVDLFLSKGFTYFDTAYGYLNGKSEKAIKAALVDRYPRESYQLATKLPAWAGAKTAEEARAMLATSLERTGAGYFDFYLLHNLGDNRTEAFDRFGIWDFLAEQKAKGVIKHLGFSFHDKADVLDDLLNKHPNMEFVQLQINYADWESASIQSRACYEVARKHGKPVIVMEPVKGGSLVNLPEDAQKVLDGLHGGSNASYAIRFAASFPGIRMVLSGMGSTEMMADNCGFMKDFQPLNEEERMAIARVCAIFRGQGLIPCTGCRYCTEVCPQGIPIPDLFACMNTKKQFHDWNSDYYYQDVRTKNAAKASDCLKCGQCEDICPQHLNIRDLLEDVAKVFEK